ncbi:MAG TPA: 4,5-dihydroxyphthalate decarboxylase [bacterium]|nr:4,5-dihydroxyphthalate decarboxylase [bacterium]
MSKLRLTLGISDYDHVRDLTNGVVAAEGIDLVPLNLVVEEIHFRFTAFREWDVSEMSLGKYISLVSRGEPPMVAIPVFPNRAFRHSSIYVRRGAGLTDPAQLAGRRVGVPEWAQTAGIYARGSLVHQYGVPLSAIEWWQAGVNQAGRAEKVELRLPTDIRLHRVADRSLTGMLQAGDLDAVMTAHPPEPPGDGGPEIVRLFGNAQAVEEAYWRATGIFPIMHIVAIKREIYAQYPWVAMNLYAAFDEARRRSVRRAFDVMASRFPVPWMADYAGRWSDLFGADYFPYGLEPNRVTLTAFCDYAYEQGVCHRRVTPEELFVSEVLHSFRI